MQYFPNGALRRDRIGGTAAENGYLFGSSSKSPVNNTISGPNSLIFSIIFDKCSRSRKWPICVSLNWTTFMSLKECGIRGCFNTCLEIVIRFGSICLAYTNPMVVVKRVAVIVETIRFKNVRREYFLVIKEPTYLIFYN